MEVRLCGDLQWSFQTMAKTADSKFTHSRIRMLDMKTIDLYYYTDHQLIKEVIHFLTVVRDKKINKNFTVTKQRKYLQYLNRFFNKPTEFQR